MVINNEKDQTCLQIIATNLDNLNDSALSFE